MASYSTIRDRNIAFIDSIGAALQLDAIGDKGSWTDVKKQITPAAVKKINEAILHIWPPNLDPEIALREREQREMGFFSGDYRPDRLVRVIARHTIYADVVGLADPFIYPLSVKDEYSPLLHPSMHLTNTAKNVLVWLRLSPLIFDGLVEVVRLPSDFSPILARANHEACNSLVERHRNVKSAIDRGVKDRLEDGADEHREWMMLKQSNRTLEEQFREAEPGWSVNQIADAMREIERRRAAHPFYLSQSGSEIVAETTGSNAFDSAQVAQITDAYLLTDLEPRWLQYGAIAADVGVGINDRSRVAHAIEKLTLPFVDQLDVQFAKKLRAEERLQDIRRLLDKFMRAARAEEPLSEGEVKAFRQEFEDSIAEARDEYKKIDEELLKWTAGGAIPSAAGIYGLTGGSLTIALGSLAASSALNLIWSGLRRSRLTHRFPSALFMQLNK